MNPESHEPVSRLRHDKARRSSLPNSLSPPQFRAQRDMEKIRLSLRGVMTRSVRTTCLPAGRRGNLVAAVDETKQKKGCAKQTIPNSCLTALFRRGVWKRGRKF
ncbi:MAG: hypothetical protein Q8L88_04950 [Bacteroidota bacterium]|nr:hypothetical protein [Bacteroidota bacterium]